jgi:hypothetical protein
MQTGRSVLFRCKLKTSSSSSSSLSAPQQLFLLRITRPWLPRAGVTSGFSSALLHSGSLPNATIQDLAKELRGLSVRHHF